MSKTRPREFWVEVYKSGMPAQAVKRDLKPSLYSIGGREWIRTIEHQAYAEACELIGEVEEHLLTLSRVGQPLDYDKFPQRIESVKEIARQALEKIKAWRTTNER